MRCTNKWRKYKPYIKHSVDNKTRGKKGFLFLLYFLTHVPNSFVLSFMWLLMVLMLVTVAVVMMVGIALLYF